MRRHEQEKIKKDQLYKKRRWAILGVGLFLFLVGLVLAPPARWLTDLAALLEFNIFFIGIVWPLVGLACFVGFFNEKVGVFLLDFSVYPYRYYFYLYKRLHLKVFKEETATELKARHTNRKLRRHERHKYSRTPKK